MTLRDETQDLSTDEVLGYVGHYVSLDKEVLNCIEVLCSQCDEMRFDPDTGDYMCPCDFDVTNPKCCNYWAVTRRLRYLIEADQMLLDTIGL